MRQDRSPRLLAVAALCAVLLLAGGCSALRLGYNQADWVAYRWFNNYVSFDDAQARGTREALSSWFLWHRKTQLPDYQDLLLKIEAEVLADTSAERTCNNGERGCNNGEAKLQQRGSEVATTGERSCHNGERSCHNGERSCTIG